MKASPRPSHPRGYVSYVVVISVGVMLFLLMMATYRSASASRDSQASSQLRIDVAEKEEAVLRALVDITPNRAIRAMQNRSSIAGAERDSLRWQNIFTDALAQANALKAVDPTVLANVSPGTRFNGNAADTTTSNLADIFSAIQPEAGYVSVGNNRSLGAGYPVYLTLNNPAQANLDSIYPIITTLKTYGANASGIVMADVNQYKLYNIIPYPRINFGYGAPGQNFVAKRNWWAFSMNLGRNDKLLGSFNATKRDFVLSIYEIPSQLAISAEAYANIGTHGDGTPWKHVAIEGGVYATRAQVGAGSSLARVAGRNGLTLDGYSTIGGTSMSGNLFVPGAKEQFELTNAEYPVYLSSESGHSAFVPINPGVRFFDRFANDAEADTLSATTWNTYSSGAMQCAMRIDVTATANPPNLTPTMLRFGYLRGGVRTTLDVPQVYAGPAALPAGFVRCCAENESYTFSQAVDVAYGDSVSGKFAFLNGVSGTVNFNNATFGDPAYGILKAGYWRPRAPFEVKMLRSTKTCIAVYPKRFPAFLAALGADTTEFNSSVAVNVDYSTTGMNNPARRPLIPCAESDYGLILQECDNLTGFTKGFSLVSNLRLYIGDDFNTVATTAPAGIPAPFYPPASIYVPERRYGAEVDPVSLKLSGQMGHLGGDNGGAPARLLDLKLANNTEVAKDNINVNLRPITHPAELPPITMMNWLIVIEERRKEFYQN